MNKKLKRDVWEKDSYWDLAKKGSKEVDHPGMKVLLRIAQDKHNVLDLGCGEGTRLKLMESDGRKLTGIDISANAIKKAKSKNSKINFISGNIEKFSFKDNQFDLVYSAFVFEHLDRPEKVIKEAVRVLETGGTLVIIAPNYGAPNRASPPYKGSRVNKLISGYINDVKRLFANQKGLGWGKVKPIASLKKYEMDWDTTIEPYLGSLIFYIKNLGLNITTTMSCWCKEEDSANMIQRVFRFLGERNIYPFKYWGPHLVLVAEK